jgi:hypothetical protein
MFSGDLGATLAVDASYGGGVTEANRDEVVGRTAHVSIAIPGGSEPGEVMARVRGGTEAYIAYASEAVELGAQVVVLADRGARSVEVAAL